MVEPPSPRLIRLLAELRLCTPADLRRCRARVRRLARDISAFDSVWIDALLQRRRLTPFQAKLLDSPTPERLAVGPCVLVDQLGGGRSAATYLARPRDGRQHCVLKLIDAPGESLPAVEARLERLTAQLSRLAHPSVVAPHTSLRDADRLVTVSRAVLGPHLGELLVRRGRFPAPVVLAAARQLVAGLAALEQLGAAHGDIGLKNVRLTTAGAAVLVDAAIAPAVAPELLIRADVAPERYDGIAPELIGTGNPATPASDAYALGCLLWHLLAGRPPFPTGDPLGKLAAHRTREIEDVRTLAPDTPAPLAELIARLTRPDPLQRPASFRDLRAQLGPPRRSGRQRLAAFHATFNTPVRRVPHGPRAPSRLKRPLVAALLFLSTGLAFSLFDQGARNIVASIASRVGDTAVRWTNVEQGKPPTPTDSPPADLPLPEPDPQGVILISKPGVYGWERIDAVGPVTVRAGDGVLAEIAVRSKPCQVVATQVTLEGLRFRRGADETSRDAEALMMVQSESLVVRGCRFDLSAARDGAQGLGIAWRELDRRDGIPGTVELRDTVFTGSGSAMFLSSVPGEIRGTNTLKLGGGPLLACAETPGGGRGLRIALEHVTLRQSGALLRGRLPEGVPAGIDVDAVDCVFDLAGKQAALVQVVTPATRTDWTKSVRISGIGTVAAPEFVAAVQIDPQTGEAVELDPAAVFVEGIAAAPFEFVGPASDAVADSSVAAHQSPTRSDQPPGISRSLAVPREPAAPR